MLRLIVLFLYVCVCGDALASAVGHANSLAKSSSYTGDMKYFGGKSYGCELVTTAADYEYSDGDVIQAIDNDMYAYKCVDVSGTANDEWQRIDTRYCEDSPVKNVQTKHAKICVYQGGKEKKCKIRGEYFDNSEWEAYKNGCVRVECIDNAFINKDGNCQERKCGDSPEGTVLENQECASDVITDSNAVSCAKTCTYRENPNRMVWVYKITECKEYYKPASNGRSCIRDIAAGDDCKGADLSGLNASAGTYQMIGGQLKCVATTCKSGAYKIKKNDVYQGYCVYDTCSDGQKLKTDGEYTDGTCEAITVEKSDENVQENSNVAESAATVSEETVPPVVDGTTGGESESNAAVDTNESEINAKQAEDRYQAQQESQDNINNLKDKAQSAKDREQSSANKLLGAAGIGATGVGGMMLASGLAEQKADADAENAMRAYLSTFTCSYGNGKNVRGGETNIELPGGNDLIALYAEYVNLANDLKARKEALGMRPGIEAETILDSATSGLYDDVAVGKTGGAYVSLARALADPDGADAKAWAAQKDESADKKKTGAITAGVGAGGALVGDLIINSGDDKKCSDGYEWDTDKKECVMKK